MNDIMSGMIKKLILTSVRTEFPTAVRIKALFNLDYVRVITSSGEYETSLQDKIDRKLVCSTFGMERLDSVVIDLNTNTIILVGDKTIRL